MKKFLDTDHPWLRPLWVRVLVVAVAGGWALLEFTTGSPFWGVLFLGLAGYAAWAFFLDPARSGPG
jgi:hypothetical protein